MAIVVYKCDTCKREIDFQQNLKGLERIQRCTITKGCRGKLYQTKILLDYVRNNIPPNVAGLDNWQQRRVLYNFSQPIERSEWTINHNLGTYPVISVFVDRPTTDDPDNQEEITPTDITIVDQNNVTLTFDRPWSGIAQLVARQSDPNTLTQTTSTTTTAVTRQQLSNNGEITIATRVSTIGEPTSINLQLTYVTPEGITRVVSYVADDQPSSDSAWSDVDKVVIKGKIYTIRSFSALTSDMTTGVIGSGSTFLFTGVDEDGDTIMRDIVENEMFILLANSPYSVFDKNQSEFVDVSAATASSQFFYNAGEFFAPINIVQSTFPAIKTL